MNSPKDKRQLLWELENSVRRIAKSINNTRGGCPYHKLGNAREHLNSVLKLNLESTIAEHMKLLLSTLQKTAKALDDTRKDFHSKKLKLIREDISNILKKYASQIN